MDKVNYDVMLAAFNAAIDGMPDDSDLALNSVIELKGLYIDLYGDSSFENLPLGEEE